MLLSRYGLNPSIEVSDSGQTLLQFAIDSAARSESIEILEDLGRKAKEKKEHQNKLAETKKSFGTDADPFKLNID